jgi:hypothetical protein
MSLSYPAHQEDPRVIRVELDTPFEDFWKVVAFLGTLASAYILFMGLHGSGGTPPDPALLPWLPYSLVIGAIGWLMYWLTDNVYLIDRDRRQILYRFRICGWQRFSKYLDFETCFTTALEGRIETTRRHRWYEYRLVLIDRQGKIHPMGNWEREDRFEALQKEAESLARWLGCTCTGGVPGHRLSVRVGKGGRVRVRLIPEPLPPPAFQEWLFQGRRGLMWLALGLALLLASWLKR